MTAGHLNVPVAMVGGDDAFIEAVAKTLGPRTAVVTPYASGTCSRRSIFPTAEQVKGTGG